MATLYTSKTSLTAPVPARVGVEGVIAVTGTYSVTSGSALALNDVIQMVKIPAGATVLDGILHTTDLDTSTGVVLDVGDGSDTDRFIDGTTVGQTAGSARFGSGVTAAASFVPYTYSAEDTIDVLVATAATGTAATTFTIQLTVFYTMQS